MRVIPFLFFSLLVGVLIAASAWPLFVTSGGILSHWFGEGSMLDAINNVPEQKIMDDFWFGYQQSMLIAIALGILAALDYFLLSQNKFTWIIAGLSLPLACIGLLFVFYKDPVPLLPTFVMTGIGLFILYRFADLIRRLFSR
ncbi:MAG: hypothetical protein V3U65_10610 [Granulosicoccaceae bacterium]